jgi:hypothetical protein
MLCFEISVNGRVVCVAGTSDDQRLEATLWRASKTRDPRIFVAGDSYRDGDWSERCIWGMQALNPDDVVNIRVIESDQPDEPIERHKINNPKEAEETTQRIIREVASLWLDRLLTGKTIPLPSGAHKTGSPPPQDNRPNELFCSFCGKSQHAVAKLIAGPGVFICNECIELCVDLVNDKESGSTTSATQAAATRWPVRTKDDSA